MRIIWATVPTRLVTELVDARAAEQLRAPDLLLGRLGGGAVAAQLAHRVRVGLPEDGGALGPHVAPLVQLRLVLLPTVPIPIPLERPLSRHRVVLVELILCVRVSVRAQ